MNENKDHSLRKHVAAIVCWHSSKHFIDLIPKDYKHFSLSFAWVFFASLGLSPVWAQKLVVKADQWYWLDFSSREKPMFYAIHIHSESIVFSNYVTHRHFVAWRLIRFKVQIKRSLNSKNATHTRTKFVILALLKLCGLSLSVANSEKTIKQKMRCNRLVCSNKHKTRNRMCALAVI